MFNWKCLFGRHNFDFVQSVGRFTSHSVKHYTLFVCDRCDKIRVETKDVTASYDIMSENFSRFLKSVSQDKKQKLKFLLGDRFYIDDKAGVEFYEDKKNESATGN